MFETIYNDLSSSVEAVVTGQEWMCLAVMGLVALAQGLTMNSFMQIWGRAAQALLIVAVIFFLWDVLDNEARFTWSNWEAEGMESWKELMMLTLKTLLGYYIVMGVAILAIYIVKSVVQR